MKLHITCKQATEFIIKREEGKLSLTKRMQLWFHFCICGFCNFFSKQSKLIGRNAANLHEHVEESLTQADKEKIIAGMEKQ